MILSKEDEKELYSILDNLETQKDYLQYNINRIKQILKKEDKKEQ